MTCVTCRSPQEAVAAARRGGFQLALVDLNYVEDTTSGKEGLARQHPRDLIVFRDTPPDVRGLMQKCAKRWPRPWIPITKAPRSTLVRFSSIPTLRSYASTNNASNCGRSAFTSCCFS